MQVIRQEQIEDMPFAQLQETAVEALLRLGTVMSPAMLSSAIASRFVS